LVYVYTVSEAAAVIKSYAPDLVVIPMDREECGQSMEMSLSRIDCLALGPGLSRHERNFQLTANVLQRLSIEKPIVVDGDGIDFFCKHYDIFDRRKFVLTPNVREYARLVERFQLKADCQVNELAAEVGGTVVRKGAEDCISNGHKTIRCSVEGAPRRCGGQGDILAGIMAARLSKHAKEQKDDPLDVCFEACAVTRNLARKTFALHGMSMIAKDMVNNFKCLL
jgi:ATP-dependent NAD(P)H-hydrate dehydratase